MEANEVPYSNQEEFESWMKKKQEELRDQLDKWYRDEWLPANTSRTEALRGHPDRGSGDSVR